jgi:hypothetical protein
MRTGAKLVSEEKLARKKAEAEAKEAWKLVADMKKEKETVKDLAALMRKPVLDHDGKELSDQSMTIENVQGRVGPEAAARAEIWAEKTMDMFRALGVEFDAERACHLLDLLADKDNAQQGIQSLPHERIEDGARLSIPQQPDNREEGEDERESPQDMIPDELMAEAELMFAEADLNKEQTETNVPTNKRSRDADDEDEVHRKEQRKFRKILPARIVTCEQCLMDRKLCDNGWPCTPCRQEGKTCYRIWCNMKQPGKCRRDNCGRVHEGDDIGGAVTARAAMRLRTGP